ncbi:MAG: hypothetical protein ABIJ72_03520 [bacterium]
MYEELVRMVDGIHVTVVVTQKGTAKGKVQAGNHVEFDKAAASKLREVAPIGAEVVVVVNMVDHPDRANRGVARWLVRGAENVQGLAENVAPGPASAPTPTTEPAPTTNGNGELKELLKPVADWLRPLIALATEIDGADEAQVASYVLAQGLNPLIGAQEEAAKAAKAEAIEAIKRARGEALVAYLVEKLSEVGEDLVEQARDDGIAAIIPQPEAPALEHLVEGRVPEAEPVQANTGTG